MKFETIFFDLDATLYPEATGLWTAIRNRIDLYLHERMGFSLEEIPEIRHDYFTNHGTTLRGLQIHYHIDPFDYLSFVHDLPLREYLSPDPQLRKILTSLPSPLWIFTNSDSQHANRVLEIMGIGDCFEGLIDIMAMDPHCKPMREAYDFALQHVGINDPKKCALLDDSIINLSPAKALGFFTVLVGNNGANSEIDRHLFDIHDLPEIVPELWDQT